MEIFKMLKLNLSTLIASAVVAISLSGVVSANADVKEAVPTTASSPATEDSSATDKVATAESDGQKITEEGGVEKAVATTDTE